MTTTAVDKAKAARDDAEAVASAFRDELKKRLDDWTANPSPEATGELCDAMHQLGAARRTLNQATLLHKTLKTRKDRENPAC